VARAQVPQDSFVEGGERVEFGRGEQVDEVSIFYRTLPAGVALQRNLAEVIGMPPWELRINGE
jgi:hypothetical protein